MAAGRIDRGRRFEQLGARKARLHRLPQQIALGLFPVGLAEHFAFFQRPSGLQFGGVELLVGRQAGLVGAEGPVARLARAGLDARAARRIDELEKRCQCGKTPVNGTAAQSAPARWTTTRGGRLASTG